MCHFFYISIAFKPMVCYSINLIYYILIYGIFMFNIPNLTHVKNYREISYGEIFELKSFSNAISQHGYDVLSQSDNKQRNIRVLDVVVNRIDKSFNRKRSFGKWFLDLITLQFIKRIVLWFALTEIKKATNAAASTIKMHRPHIQIPFVENDPLSLVTKAFEKFETRRNAELRAKSGDNDWRETALEVNEYFQNTLQMLKAGQSVPLPRWFHATKNGVDAIAQSRKLKQFEAPMGKGAYFSTRDESYGGYGDYTYAVDESAIYDKPGAYFEGFTDRYPTLETKAVWVRVESNVDISPDNIAYIAAPNSRDRDVLKEKIWGQGVHWNTWEKGFYVPVITRAASDWIRQSFASIGHIYDLPDTWRRHENKRHMSISHLRDVREPT